jgi:hypothetical protein
MKIPKIAGAAAVSLFMSPFSVLAATQAEVDEMVVTTRFLKQRYEEQERTIHALQKRLGQLEQHLASSIDSTRGRGTAANNESMLQAIAQVNNGLSPQVAQSAQTLPSSGGPVTTSTQPTSTQAQAITSTQGIPLFDRRFSIEQGLTYTHYDKRSLVLSGFLALDAILLGKIDLQQIKTDQLQYDLTGRMNLSDRVSMDLNLPLIYRKSKYVSPGAGGAASAVSEASSNTTALGDVNAGLYYQLPKKSPTDLDWIASIRVKAPTGRHPFGIKLRDADPVDAEPATANNNLVIPSRQPTGNGVWNTSLGLSVLKTYDPVVLFGNIAYGYNFERSFSDLSSTEGTTTPGDVQMGSTWSLGAGFALALNEKMSVSFSYSQLLQKAARLRGSGGPWVRQAGTDVNSAMFNSGLTHQLSRNLSMVGTVSVGLSPDAPDFSVGIKFPYTF